jgi:hypothetical protein
MEVKMTIKDYLGKGVKASKDGNIHVKYKRQLIATVYCWRDIYAKTSSYKKANEFECDITKFIADAINEKLEREK